MIGEMLLFGLVTGCGGVLYYLHQDHVRTKDERARLEAEQAERTRIIAEEQDRQRTNRFRDQLLRELKASGSSAFRLDEFSNRFNVTRQFALDVAKSIYSAVLRGVVSDGVVTDEEQRKLANLVTAFGLDQSWAKHAEQEAKLGQFGATIDRVFADGQVTSGELAELEEIRRSLGLSKVEASDAATPQAVEAYLNVLTNIANSGTISDLDKQEISRIKKVAGLADVEWISAIRSRSTNLFRQCFTSVVQDGVVTSEEKSLLNWFQREIGMSEQDARPYQERIRRAELLRDSREGKLTPVTTRKLLDGGETCYFDGECHHLLKMRNSQTYIPGDLLITSKKVIFLSDKKSISFAPWKILDVDIKRDNQLSLKVDARSGSGDYLSDDPHLVEAVLTGLAKKLKYSTADSYSSTLSRHITPVVKREVWARDGGLCVQCGASDYLEFDHIIPHSQGGANTVGNIQILCRKCNLAKRDRI